MSISWRCGFKPDNDAGKNGKDGCVPGHDLPLRGITAMGGVLMGVKMGGGGRRSSRADGNGRNVEAAEVADCDWVNLMVAIIFIAFKAATGKRPKWRLSRHSLVLPLCHDSPQFQCRN